MLVYVSTSSHLLLSFTPPSTSLLYKFKYINSCFVLVCNERNLLNDLVFLTSHITGTVVVLHIILNTELLLVLSNTLDLLFVYSVLCVHVMFKYCCILYILVLKNSSYTFSIIICIKIIYNYCCYSNQKVTCDN